MNTDPPQVNNGPHLLTLVQTRDNKKMVRPVNTDKIKAKIYKMDYHASKSIRYHDRRATFLGNSHKALLTFAFLLLVASIFNGANDSLFWAFMLALFSAFTSMFDVLCNFSVTIHIHRELSKRFNKLKHRIAVSSNEDVDFRKITKEYLGILADEPPAVYLALEADCDNSIRYARGRTQELAEISWWERKTMNFLTHSGKRFPLKKQEVDKEKPR